MLYVLEVFLLKYLALPLILPLRVKMPLHHLSVCLSTRLRSPSVTLNFENHSARLIKDLRCPAEKCRLGQVVKSLTKG